MTGGVPNIDIRPDHWRIVRDILARHVPDREVWAFGSRATWTAKDYSDLDLAILGEQPLPSGVRAALEEDFSELDLPYKVDLVEWAGLGEGFRAIVKRDRVVVKVTGDEPEICPGNAVSGIGSIADYGWTDGTIGDLITLQRGIDLPAESRTLGNVPIMGSFGVTGWHAEAACKGPGVTVGRSGASAGSVSYTKEDYWPLNTCLYVKDFKGNDPQFVYYLLQTFDLASLNSGSAQPSLNRNFVHPVPARFPKPDEQRRISSVLAALDDKIELNRQMNETLEAMARQLFRDWFVDFGPTRAQIEGRAPYLPSDLWSLFPDRLDDDGMPEGWTKIPLSDLTSKIGSGSTPGGGKFAYVENGVSFIRSQNVHDFQFSYNGLVRINDTDAYRLRGVSVNEGDVLINITGDSILRTCVVDPGVLPARVNQHVSIVRAKEKVLARFLHLFLVQPETKAVLLGFDAGASRAAITKKHLEELPVTVPQNEVVGWFSRMSMPWFDHVDQNNAQSRTLTTLRDTLLPKLMSGEIRVREAEKLVEAVL